MALTHTPLSGTWSTKIPYNDLLKGENRNIVILDINDQNTMCVFASKGTQATYIYVQAFNIINMFNLCKQCTYITSCLQIGSLLTWAKNEGMQLIHTVYGFMWTCFECISFSLCTYSLLNMKHATRPGQLEIQVLLVPMSCLVMNILRTTSSTSPRCGVRLVHEGSHLHVVHLAQSRGS